MSIVKSNLTYLTSTQRGRRIALRIVRGGPRHIIASLRNPYLGG